MCFYKGYILTNEKKSMQKFSDGTPLKTLEQVQPFEEYAGVIASDSILVDFDDAASADKALNIIEDQELVCRVYQTTRGIHVLFKNSKLKNCPTHTRLACGLTADIKCGHSKACYEVLKYAGKERQIIYDKFDDEEYQEIPKIFYPIKSRIDFNDLESGDGRNQSLFNYILTLQSAGFTTDEARGCLKIINKYVLKDSLSDKELDTICRDESFEAPIFFDEKNRFLFDKFARYMISEHKIIKIEDNLYIYDDGVYSYNPLKIEHYMIEHIPTLTQSARTEVMNYISVVICDNTEPSSARYIAFNNGVYDFEEKRLIPYDPSMILLNKIPHNYNPQAHDEVCNKTLNKLACNDASIRALLEEAIGYCFFRRNELRKSFMLIGDKANGKSTFLDMVRNVLGLKNISSLDLHELSDRFKTAELCGKLANIGDDIGDGYISETAVFKKVVSGDRLNVERKGQDPFEFDNYSKQLFSCNSLPRIKDNTGAVMSRLIIVPFNATFSATDADFDPYIKYKLRSENTMEYLINIGIKALHRVLDRNAFTTSEESEKMIAEYNLDNNPLIRYIGGHTREHFLNNSVDAKYAEYALQANGKGVGKHVFVREARKYYKFSIKRTLVDTTYVDIFV